MCSWQIIERQRLGASGLLVAELNCTGMTSLNRYGLRAAPGRGNCCRDAGRVVQGSTSGGEKLVLHGRDHGLQVRDDFGPTFFSLSVSTRAAAREYAR